jgi:uncharacterized protein with von Willebrand factor type A (vWA) domain
MDIMVEVKTEIEGIVRDIGNGALLNKDVSGLDAYKKIKKKNQEMEEVKNKVNNIESEISEIKNLLLKLVEKNQ